MAQADGAELRERVARSLHEWESSRESWESAPAVWKDDCREQADAILALIDADARRREREAYVQGAASADPWGSKAIHESAKAEALRRYPEVTP